MKKIFIKEGAIFIADAHFLPEQSEQFDALMSMLRERASGKNAPQIIILGDFFAALFGGVRSSMAAYKKMICALDKLERVIYFEGNHDFKLNELFKNITIISTLVNQAVFFTKAFDSHICTKTLANLPPKSAQNLRWRVLRVNGFVQHGDVFLPRFTQFALWLLRSKIFLKTADFLDFQGSIYARILATQRKKVLYKKLQNFEQITKMRLEKLRKKGLKMGLIIEGHFHQNQAFFSKDFAYYNLAAFSVIPALWRLDEGLKITSN